jgi:hypothetical protein
MFNDNTVNCKYNFTLQSTVLMLCGQIAFVKKLVLHLIYASPHLTLMSEDGIRLAQTAIECLLSYRNSDIRLTNVHLNPKGETTASVLGLVELDSSKLQHALSMTQGRVHFSIGRSAYDGSAMQCTLRVTPHSATCLTGAMQRSALSKITESCILLTSFAVFHTLWLPQAVN